MKLLPLLLAFSASMAFASPLPQLGSGLSVGALTGDKQLGDGLRAILGSGKGGGRGRNETEDEKGLFEGFGGEEEEERKKPVKTYAFGEDGCVKYGADGRDANGFDKNGLDRNGHDLEGYGLDGFNAQNRTRHGNDRLGRDAKGNYGTFNVNGRDIEGYDIGGFGPDGFSRQGRNRQGLDKDGYNLRGLNAAGADRRKCMSVSHTSLPSADTSTSTGSRQDGGDDELDLANIEDEIGGFDELEGAY